MDRLINMIAGAGAPPQDSSEVIQVYSLAFLPSPHFKEILTLPFSPHFPLGLTDRGLTLPLSPSLQQDFKEELTLPSNHPYLQYFPLAILFFST